MIEKIEILQHGEAATLATLADSNRSNCTGAFRWSLSPRIVQPWYSYCASFRYCRSCTLATVIS